MPTLRPTEPAICDVVPQKPIGDGRSYWCHTHGCTALPVCLRQIGAAPGQHRYQDWPALYPEALDQAADMVADIQNQATAAAALSHAEAAVTAAARYRQTDIPDEAADLHHHASRCAAALLVLNPPAAAATDRWNRIAKQAAAMLAAHIEPAAA